jgi:short-subunit dehydrogenase
MKTVLITGASSGIGMSTALLLNQKGFVVYAAARRIERMNILKDEGINILKMDVSKDESMVNGIEEIVKKHGSIDILINNAGYGSFGAFEDVPLSEGKYQFEVNVFGLARITQLVLPYMRKKKYGKIINISSIAGKMYQPMGSWYHASKFAIEGMSDCLRV